MPPSRTEPPAHADSENRVWRIQRGFERMLTLSRLLVLIPVIFLLLDAVGSFVYGSDILVRSATGLIGEPAQVGGRLGLFLIVMDTFLVGATLMIAAFGFYELFIIKNEREGRRYWLPAWLKMHDLEDLKARVVSMLILVAAITFVDRTVEAHDEQEVLFLGVGISIIIVALTAFLWFGKRRYPAADAPVAAVAAVPPAGPPVPPADTPAPPADTPAPPADAPAPPADAPAPPADPPAPPADPPAPPADADPYAPPASPAAPRADPPAAHPGPAAPLAGPPPPTANDAALPADLPAPTASEAALPAAGTGRPPGAARPQLADRATRPRAAVVALLGSTRREGGWNASPRTDVFALAGRARIDLTDADVRGERLMIRVISVLGLVTIVVPTDMTIAESGLALLGSRSVRGGTAETAEAGRPELLLSGACILGAVRVRRKAVNGPSGHLS